MSRHTVRLDKIRAHWGDMLQVAGSLAMGAVRAYDLIRMLSTDGRTTGLGEAFAHYGRIFKTLHLSVTWNQASGKILLPLVQSRTEEKRWARWCWRRSGPSCDGMSRLPDGCGSGPIWGGHLGRSTPTPEAWPSTLTGASARASTRCRPPANTSPVTCESSARG
ncbi:Tn3 family transposase [Streptosporangium amethystogenes]|uniref:Tn3 family transposase n=1 Tax=Streptosporangium amethystogenes TaxID=2002 RepID=UPI00378ADE68